MNCGLGARERAPGHAKWGRKWLFCVPFPPHTDGEQFHFIFPENIGEKLGFLNYYYCTLQLRRNGRERLTAQRLEKGPVWLLVQR